jgi:hypothetical protein
MSGRADEHRSLFMWHAPLTVNAGNLPEEKQISEPFSADFFLKTQRLKYMKL